MKNLVLVFLILTLGMISIAIGLNFKNFQLRVEASSGKTIYARVMADNVFLYRNAIDNDDFSNIYFELPRTYFVELIDDYNSSFYVASYLGINGYVKKDSVTAIAGTPTNPFLTGVYLRVYSEQSQNMRKLPTSSGGSDNQEYFLPQDNLNINYIGKIVGEPYVNKRTKIWYYCKFVDSSEHFGYVYAEFCDDGDGNDIVIPQNREEVTYTANPNFSKQVEQETSLPVESKTTWIVIGILSVPAIIFVLLFLKGGKIASKDKKLPNKEVKDY